MKKTDKLLKIKGLHKGEALGKLDGEGLLFQRLRFFKLRLLCLFFVGKSLGMDVLLREITQENDLVGAGGVIRTGFGWFFRLIMLKAKR